MVRVASDYAWCFLFAPALLLYLTILMGTVNHYAADGFIASDITFVPTGRTLFTKGTPIEILASGFQWTEGPLWIDGSDAGSGHLLFSDTILNQIWRYDRGNGIFTVGQSLFINESGCATNTSRCAEVFEPGSNGIARVPFTLTADLAVCQHGDRAVSILFENGTRTVIANRYKGLKLNSPNDLVWSRDGHLYFTDPPYGMYDSVAQCDLLGEELGFYGVYMVHRNDVEDALRTGLPTENVILLDNSLSRPNGIAFSPNFRTLYVANSDSTDPIWVAFDVDDKTGLVQNRRVFADARDVQEEGEHYSASSFPDGFKVSEEGVIVSSAPGGIFLLMPDGQLLSKIKISEKVSNVAFGGDGYLYVTSTAYVLRIKTSMKGSNQYSPRW